MDIETDDNSSNINLNDDQIYCICKRTLSQYETEDDLMIECIECKDWLHGKCVKISALEASDIDQYVCPRCITQDKKIIFKKRRNFHRHDYTDKNADRKAVQAGTLKFIEILLTKNFLSSNDIIRVLNGDELTTDYLDKYGFDYPIYVETKEKLNLKMPENEFNLNDIETLIGKDYKLDVIDCERQQTFNMTMNELREYFDIQPRNKVLNLISLEISKTPLGDLVSIPEIVSKISWVSNGIWPDTIPNNASYTKPEVQKYCLISAQGSYTDFHVDFGGSSVWYHVLKGSKIFYLIEPNETNLSLYEKWNSIHNHTEIFFANKVEKCYKLEIKAGNTIFLPCGWIHAVYTPEDSIVFGGNYETSYKIPLQIKIYEMENRLKVPEKYRFPYFATLQWYAAKYYLNVIKQSNKDRKCVQSYLLNGCKFLRDTLKKWLSSKDYYVEHGHEIPEKLNCEKLIKVLNKELNKADILSNYYKKNEKNSSNERVVVKIKLTQAPNNTDDLKLTYTDNDYIYPNLNDDFESNDEQTNQKPQENETSNGKRVKKIKPHALKYLSNDGSSKVNQNCVSIKEENDEAKLSDDDDDDVEDDKPKKKKKTDLKNSPLKQTIKQKTAKKGYATAKQRLGKILKINRIFNI